MQIYLLKSFTSHCQVKCDSVEKLRSYRLSNVSTYWFSSIQKCSSWKCYLIYIKMGTSLLPMKWQWCF